VSAKGLAVGAAAIVAALAIAKNAPEFIAEKIRTEVNSMKLSTRLTIAWRVVRAKL